MPLVVAIAVEFEHDDVSMKPQPAKGIQRRFCLRLRPVPGVSARSADVDIASAIQNQTPSEISLHTARTVKGVPQVIAVAAELQNKNVAVRRLATKEVASLKRTAWVRVVGSGAVPGHRTIARDIHTASVDGNALSCPPAVERVPQVVAAAVELQHKGVDDTGKFMTWGLFVGSVPTQLAGS